MYLGDPHSAAVCAAEWGRREDAGAALESEVARLAADGPALARLAFDDVPFSLLKWMQDAARLAPDEAFTAETMVAFLADHLDPGGDLLRVDDATAWAWKRWLTGVASKRLGE